MGGFTLVGPHYVFNNIPTPHQCRCIGYNGAVNQTVESFLLNKEEKVLDSLQLPDEKLISEMKPYHLGEERRYTVHKRINEQDTGMMRSVHQMDKVAPSRFPWSR